MVARKGRDAGGTMPQQPRPEPPEPIEPLPHPTEPLQIETPVINMQDLEYVATAHTRVSNKGVRVEPRIGDEPRIDDHGRDLAREDEAAIEALEEFEKSMKKLPPG
jgi:hypothetical protein